MEEARKTRLMQFVHDLTIFTGVLCYIAGIVFVLGYYQVAIQRVGGSNTLVLNAVTTESVMNEATDALVGKSKYKVRP